MNKEYIDQTNIYSYRGNSFMLDFEKYLRDHGITVDETELMNGMIGIWLTGSRKPVMVPQHAQWGDVVRKLEGKSAGRNMGNSEKLPDGGKE
jgi:hypothetical protein